MQRPDYGIDAPPVVRNLALGGAAGVVLGIAALFFLRPFQPTIAVVFASCGQLGWTFVLLSHGQMVCVRKVG